VDGSVANEVQALTNLGFDVLAKLSSILIITPTFIAPSALIGLFATLCSNIYMRAQLSVKRELSNKRAPVMGHFGAAIAGLSTLSLRLNSESVANRSPLKHLSALTELKRPSDLNPTGVSTVSRERHGQTIISTGPSQQSYLVGMLIKLRL
jgi:hypothetical protein